MRRPLPVSGTHGSVLVLWTPLADSSCLLPQATSESGLTVLFPWSVSCDVTLLNLPMKLKCHRRRAESCPGFTFPSVHPFGYDAQKKKLPACFPESFPPPCPDLSCSSRFFEAPAFLFLPPRCFVQRCLASFLGCFFF